MALDGSRENILEGEMQLGTVGFDGKKAQFGCVLSSRTGNDVKDVIGSQAERCEAL